jgi:hypothetical protein
VTFARHRMRDYLTLPEGLVGLRAVPVALGECRFCNQKADVFNITPAPGTRTFPIILHVSQACNKLEKFYTKPGSTGCADQTNGVYKLE